MSIARCMHVFLSAVARAVMTRARREGTMMHSHLVSRRTALKVGAGVAAMPLVDIRSVRAADQKTFSMGYDPAGPTCHLGQYAALVKGFFAEEGLRVQELRR